MMAQLHSDQSYWCIPGIQLRTQAHQSVSHRGDPNITAGLFIQGSKGVCCHHSLVKLCFTVQLLLIANTPSTCMNLQRTTMQNLDRLILCLLRHLCHPHAKLDLLARHAPPVQMVGWPSGNKATGLCCMHGKDIASIITTTDIDRIYTGSKKAGSHQELN